MELPKELKFINPVQFLGFLTLSYIAISDVRRTRFISSFFSTTLSTDKIFAYLLTNNQLQKLQLMSSDHIQKFTVILPVKE